MYFLFSLDFSENSLSWLWGNSNVEGKSDFCLGKIYLFYSICQGKQLKDFKGDTDVI